MVMEPCEAYFVKYLLEDSILSNRGEEIQSFSKGCVTQFFLECGKAVDVKCDFDWKHDLQPVC